MLAAIEIEFVVFDATTGQIAGRGGPAYGLGPLLDHAAFVDDLHRDFEYAGLSIEQLHAEYGSGQMELSIAPGTPLQAADGNVLARPPVGRAAGRHGLRVSMSPRPLVEGVGTGAHVHLSFLHGDAPLLAAGSGPYGITTTAGPSSEGSSSGFPR